jgi:LPXTG-site transpeptidase (sortase) family protein
VEIPKIGVQAPLIALGLNPDRTMEVPTQRGVAGWYQYSPAPGAMGPSVIAGHVSLSGRPDVFHRLVDLEPGDEVAVRYANGDVVNFTVYEIEQHPKEAFPTERVYANTDAPELRLITCGGEFDQSRRSYRDNIIAYARISQ